MDLYEKIACGYSEIANEFADLVELIKD